MTLQQPSDLVCRGAAIAAKSLLVESDLSLANGNVGLKGRRTAEMSARENVLNFKISRQN